MRAGGEMSTSPLGGRLLGNIYGLTQYTPVGAAIARDFAVNNLLHFADEYAQVRVAWTPTVTTYSGGTGYLTGRTSALSVNIWYPIASYGPFPIALREDGRSYRLRVRIAGASSGGHAVKFRLVLAPQSEAPARVTQSLDSIYETATTTSSTGAWLTGASVLSSLATQVQATSEETSAWITTTSTLTDLAGDDTGASQCLVSCAIYGSTANVASIPRLHGVYAAEWIGDD